MIFYGTYKIPFNSILYFLPRFKVIPFGGTIFYHPTNRVVLWRDASFQLERSVSISYSVSFSLRSAALTSLISTFFDSLVN